MGIWRGNYHRKTGGWKMSLGELKRIGQDFFLNGDNMTDYYYSGTHQIVLSGDCIDAALDALTSIEAIHLLFYDDGYYCYIVAPQFDEESFFNKVVSVVEKSVAGISINNGTYSVRRKIPATPKLPAGPDDACTVGLGNITYYKVVIHLGRGYGRRWSQVSILMPKEGREIYYQVQRYFNKVSGSQIDGESKMFTGIGAQWQAICFAYGFTPDEAKDKEAAQRAKKFVYTVVGEMMDRLWSCQTQPSFLSRWRSASLLTT